jgi:hypothetical protein
MLIRRREASRLISFRDRNGRGLKKLALIVDHVSSSTASNPDVGKI